MNSLNLSDMFNSSKTNVLYNEDATRQNLELVLLSSKKSLMGDPYFGTNLARLLYDNNDKILADLIIDNVEEAIVNFMPQLYVKRSDIKVYANKQRVFVRLKALNKLNGVSNTYDLSMLNNSEF